MPMPTSGATDQTPGKFSVPLLLSREPFLPILKVGLLDFKKRPGPYVGRMAPLKVRIHLL